MIPNMMLIRRGADLKQLSNILGKETYDIHPHNSRTLLLILKKRPDTHREMLLELYLAGNRVSYD